MPSIDRRELLAGVAALGGVAGCLGGADDDRSPSTDEQSTPRNTRSATPTPRQTASVTTGTLSLTPVEPSGVDGPVTVLPADLRGWIRRATAGEVVRAHAESSVSPAVQTYGPIPPLVGFDRPRIDDPNGGAGGVYDLDATGGVRYELLVGAETASPPEEADVTAVSSLPERRRELALAAIGAADGSRRVYPETERGSWARTAFFGGYYRHDGTVYRGHEVQQTDAAFFSMRLWYVLAASTTDADPTATLRLARPSDAARRLVDDLRSDHETVTRMERGVEANTAAAAETLAAEHPRLLTHDAIFRAEFEA